MICNSEAPMCIAGVFGGQESGISDTTTNVFLESACFDPVFVRKTARRHGLNTDASFRYERGTDPNIVIYALKLAAMMIKEVAGGKITCAPIDIYPEPVKDFEVFIKYVVLGFLGGILPETWILAVIMVLAIGSVAAMYVYSYLIWRKSHNS